MKKSREHIEAEVMKTLKILDDMQDIRPHHLFRAHLMQKIEEETEKRFSSALPRSISSNLRLAFIALLLLINITSALLFFGKDPLQPMAAITGDQLETFSEDYASPALSYYAQPTGDQTNNDE
jgi:hypothetical protein